MKEKLEDLAEHLHSYTGCYIVVDEDDLNEAKQEIRYNAQIAIDECRYIIDELDDLE